MERKPFASLDGVPQAVIDLLVNFPANGKPVESNALHMAVEAGLVKQHHQKTPCRTCGTPQHSYSYYKPTLGGRWLRNLVRGDGE